MNFPLYRYDDAGNRIRKQVWQYQGQEPDPVYEGDNPSWQLESDEFYIRDVNGKEVAIYNGSSLTQWNLWAMDQVGHMNADTSKYFYLKDHLGSVRAVINTQNQVVSAQDYDAWGYLHDTRTYSANNKYKFTGKERDLESNYDYFGARYYDSRIGRWGGVEPRSTAKLSFTPFNYSSCNPTNRVDPDGEWDIDVHVYNDRSEYSYGVAIVRDMYGDEVFRFDVRVEGQHRDRLKTNGDTPLGVYDIPDKNMWLTGKSRQSYGPNPRLILQGESGEIKESGRTDIRIHGGRQEQQDKKGNWIPVKNPSLKPTHGCIRAYDNDMKKMKTITAELEANFSDEYGGKLRVIDDLEYQNGQYVIPGPERAKPGN